jgi:hypothetical protein
VAPSRFLGNRRLNHFDAFQIAELAGWICHARQRRKNNDRGKRSGRNEQLQIHCGVLL